MRFFFRAAICLSLILCSLVSNGQIFHSVRTVHQSDPSKLSAIERMEDTLIFYADSMFNSPIPEARIEGSYAFIKSMKKYLQMPQSFNSEAKKLAKSISIIQPEDKTFKIYSWEIIRSNTEVRYYGALQLADGSYQPLVDASDQIVRGAEDSTFFNSRWYGCIYYNIIQKKVGTQNAYFLFGYNGNLVNGDKKIVESFGFDKTGRAIFGAPLFKIRENGAYKVAMRFILNYQKNSKVSMNYDKEMDMIVYDHCESSVGDDNKKNTYVPDGTYDGLKWDGRYWQQQVNVVQIVATPDGQAPITKPIK